MAREGADFVDRHPRARALHERARRSLLAGVPMNWMVKWAGAFPLYVEDASGAHFRDVDGHDYIDFCLGDTGAMAGHGAAPTIAAVERQLRRGITTMLPTEDAIWAGEELTRRFGLPYWQFTITATDANRFALRLARHDHGPAADRGPRPQLPRHGGRDVRLADAGRARRIAARQPGPAGGSGDDHPRRPVQRPRRARSGAGRRAGGGPADRAGAHERRDRPAGARLPRGRPGDHAAPRDRPHPRRDPHDLRRARAA